VYFSGTPYHTVPNIMRRHVSPLVARRLLPSHQCRGGSSRACRYILVRLVVAVVTVSTTSLVMSTTAALSFPDSQDPFAAGPPISYTIKNNNGRRKKVCRISLFNNVSLEMYSQVLRFPYSPEPGRTSPLLVVIVLS